MFLMPATQDVHVLQQLLLSETHIKEQALAKINALEQEILALKSMLAANSPTATDQPNAGAQEHSFNGEIILVVDDQQLNLDIVASLLEDVQLTIVCMSSAAEALDYMRGANPALVLMDIQMPQMDGYCATEKIRSEFAHLNPVILAMTANNTDEDRAKSIASGMQGHICKPIDADYLLDQLNYWLNARTPCSAEHIQSGSAQDAVAAYPSVQPQAINACDEELPGIDLPSAMARLRGNRTLFDEVLISFATTASLIIPQLRQTIAENNSVETSRIVHRLKGTAANLSAYKIAPLAALLETQSNAGQMPNDDELFKLNAVLNEIIATAEQLQKSKAEPSASSQPVTYAQIEPLLQCISANLHNDLGQAEEAIEALSELCPQTIWAENTAKLRTLFYQFNLRAVNEIIAQDFRDPSL